MKQITGGVLKVLEDYRNFPFLNDSFFWFPLKSKNKNPSILKNRWVSTFVLSSTIIYNESFQHYRTFSLAIRRVFPHILSKRTTNAGSSTSPHISPSRATYTLVAWHPPTQACHSWNSIESQLAACSSPGATPRSPQWQLHLASPQVSNWNQHAWKPFPEACHLKSFSPGAIALLSLGHLWCGMARSGVSSTAPSDGSRPKDPNGPTSLFEAMAKGFWSFVGVGSFPRHLVSK